MPKETKKILEELREEAAKIAKEMEKDIKKRKIQYIGKDGMDYSTRGALESMDSSYEAYKNPKKRG